jgi:cell wall-associated NlpC family hydrolase
MKRKRLITTGVMALILTIGTGQAFGAILEATTAAQEAVTEVQKKTIISGPVQTPLMSAGPVLKSDSPIVGSHDWLAQEKAERDKLESDAAQTKAELEAEIARLKTIADNTKNLNEAIELVKAQVGVSRWYAGGSSPPYWDCSGLVRWAYLHVGVDMRHSATAQRDFGTIVTEPKIGDLVSFSHRGRTSAYHIGIYIGPDQMVHSGGKPGTKTEIRSIIDWAEVNGNSEIAYTRILETNN